jgi:DNA polymerase-3 subunit delta'
VSLEDRDVEAAARALPWQEALPWHGGPLREGLAQRDTWPHAVLIHGPRGIGKHALALAFAQALLCEAPRGGGLACGACPGCRYAAAGEHPDLMRLELLDVDSKDDELKPVDEIKIARVRKLIDFVALSSHRHRAKVGVIAPAERMNVQAANALLKTLEEPPLGTYLILVADLPGLLPPTIVSRCRKMAAPLPARDAALAWLAAQDVVEPELVLAQAGGAPRIALALADAAVQVERRAWLTALAQPERLSVVALASGIDAGGRDERRARLARLIDWLLAWTGDLARVAAGAAPRRNPDFAASLGKLATRLAPLAAFRYHSTLLRQRGLLAHPLAPRLVAEAMLIDYRALFR